jgi:hypothetical protein
LPKKTSVELRVPLGLGQRLHDIVFAAGRHEYVAFCLVSHFTTADRVVLLVRRILELPAHEYVDDTSHGARWRGSSMLPVIAAAMDEDLGIVVVHSHAFGPARLSPDDLSSASRLVPMFQRRVPDRPHGSIVLVPGSAGGIIALPGEVAQAPNLTVRWLGSALVDWPLVDSGGARTDEIFDRQALVVGAQGALTRARVAVAGLCGGGGHVVQQFAHAGAGTIVGIDADHAEPPNLHRVPGMRRADVRSRAKKIKVMERLVRSIGTGSTFVGVDAFVPQPAALDALKSADVIVGCLDNLHARADLQEIAWRHLIPYVDVGVGIRALEGTASDPRVSIGGSTIVLVPGGFCLWCCGYLSQAKLDKETEGRGRSYFKNKGGNAQVIAFNGSVASQAVAEVLQLITGFRGASFDPSALELPENQGQRGYLKFDGLRGTSHDWGGRRREACPCCSQVLGAGSVVWKAAS